MYLRPNRDKSLLSHLLRHRMAADVMTRHQSKQSIDFASIIVVLFDANCTDQKHWRSPNILSYSNRHHRTKVELIAHCENQFT